MKSSLIFFRLFFSFVRRSQYSARKEKNERKKMKSSLIFFRLFFFLLAGSQTPVANQFFTQGRRSSSFSAHFFPFEPSFIFRAASVSVIFFRSFFSLLAGYQTPVL
jgi:hypothetical protein